MSDTGSDFHAGRLSPLGPTSFDGLDGTGSRSARQLDEILHHLPIGVMLVNAARGIELCNRRALDLLGLPASLMDGQPTFGDVLAFQSAHDEFTRMPDALHDFVRAGGLLERPHTYERTRPDGCVIEVESVPLERGGVLRTYTDITERRRAEERMRYRSRHDGLTTLINRETFLEMLREKVALASGTDTTFAVLYLDLDRFKPVNDTLGHAAGDHVLTVVAQRIRHAIRDDDVAARMGGDEFAIIQAVVVDPQQTVQLGQRLVRSLSPPIEIDGDSVTIGVSAGIALFPAQGATAEALLRNADAALYAVKCRGGGDARLFERVGPA